MFYLVHREILTYSRQSPNYFLFDSVFKTVRSLDKDTVNSSLSLTQILARIIPDGKLVNGMRRLCGPAVRLWGTRGLLENCVLSVPVHSSQAEKHMAPAKDRNISH
jgi:hypothetical protein